MGLACAQPINRNDPQHIHPGDLYIYIYALAIERGRVCIRMGSLGNQANTKYIYNKSLQHLLRPTSPDFAQSTYKF